MADAKTQYRRASDVAPGIGKKLDEIAGRDVLLVNFTKETRMQGAGEQRGDKVCVLLTVATDVSKPEVTTLYHAWSEGLYNRLAEIEAGDLPLLITFEKVTTSNGTQAWSYR